jgi:hypothetical protein
MQNSRMQNSKTQNSQRRKSEMQNSRTQNRRVQNSQRRNSQMQNSRTQNSRTQNSRMQDQMSLYRTYIHSFFFKKQPSCKRKMSRIRTRKDPHELIFFFNGEFLDFQKMYFIQHCFMCRPTGSTVSEDAWIELWTVLKFVMAVIYALITRLDLIKLG